VGGNGSEIETDSSYVDVVARARVLEGQMTRRYDARSMRVHVTSHVIASLTSNRGIRLSSGLPCPLSRGIFPVRVSQCDFCVITERGKKESID
jgi:hypothetical protein